MSIPNTTTTRPQAPPIPPHVALPLIQNRAARLRERADLNMISRPDLVRALEGIADDLAVVVTQLAAVTA
jgi:hypothetical protein